MSLILLFDSAALVMSFSLIQKNYLPFDTPEVLTSTRRRAMSFSTAFTASSGVGSRRECGARLACGAGRPRPRWCCRRGADGAQRSGHGRSSERSRGRQQAFGPGRGRGAKRTALYDAMAAYAAHFSPLLENELRAEQAAYKATTGAPETSGSILRGLRITKDGRLFGQMQYVLRNSVRSMRLDEWSLISKGDLVDIRISDGGGNEQIQNNGDEALTAAEASVLERNSWTLTVTAPLGSESARILDMFVQDDVVLDVIQGTNALAYERAIAAMNAITDKSEEQSLVVNTIVRSLQPIPPSLSIQKKANRSVQKSLSSGSDKETQTEISAGIVDEESEITTRTNRLHAEFLSGPSTRIVQDLTNSASKGRVPEERCQWEDAARASAPNSNLPAVEQAVREVSGINIPLNSAQRAALRSSLSRTITLVQGPPGTGKTQTAARMIVGAVLAGCGPVLATASSNVAVDNLMEAFLDLRQDSLRIVRVGRVAAVKERLWDLTLEGLLERDGKVRSARQRAEKDPSEFPSAKEAEKLASERILRSADVVLCTCVSAGREVLESVNFRYVLCDEATQATEPDLLIPLATAGGGTLRQLVLVGDHHQLPPTVISNSSVLSCSLFLRMWSLGVMSTMLNTQYRMHPQIALFPARYFYFGKLSSAITEDDRPLPPPATQAAHGHEGQLIALRLLREKRVVFVDVRDGHDWMDSSTTELNPRYSTGAFSFINEEEAAVLVSIVLHLPFPRSDIGVISPYSGQVRLLSRRLGREPGGVEVATVDGFQGREKEVIVLSCVRSNEEGRVGFLSDWRRLNVAITRARTALIVIGSGKTLRNDPHWRSWLRHAKIFDSAELPWAPSKL
jgi:hypothetical protein